MENCSSGGFPQHTLFVSPTLFYILSPNLSLICAPALAVLPTLRSGLRVSKEGQRYEAISITYTLSRTVTACSSRATTATSSLVSHASNFIAALFSLPPNFSCLGKELLLLLLLMQFVT